MPLFAITELDAGIRMHGRVTPGHDGKCRTADI
jgi:hypothetical protein